MCNQSSAILSIPASSGHGWWEPESDVLCLFPRSSPWHGLSRLSHARSPWAHMWAHVHAGVCTCVPSTEAPQGVCVKADPLSSWFLGPRAAPGWQGTAMGKLMVPLQWSQAVSGGCSHQLVGCRRGPNLQGEQTTTSLGCWMQQRCGW